MASKHSPDIDIPIDEQRRSWDAWNAAAREAAVGESSLRQADVVERLVGGLGRADLEIIDVGCGTGWLCSRLARYGQVTGTDLVDQVIERARTRFPQVRFLSGNIFELDLPRQHYDVVVSLEVLAHVADQRAFSARLAELLKPGGRLVLATQNRPVFERWSAVGAANPGQIRRWVNARELHALLRPHFEDIRISSLFPVGDRGWLRLVNSPRLNRLLGSVVSAATLERWKERAMLGHSLMATATRRDGSVARGAASARR